MAELSDASTSSFADVAEGTYSGRIHFNDAGQGPAVVMVHGGGPGATGWSNYHRNIGPFVDAGFRVLLIDCPGFGQSDPLITDEPMDAVFARAVRGLLRSLGIDKAHVIGNSLGGSTALSFAFEYPENLDRLVLMGPAGLGTSIFTPMPMEGIKDLMRLYSQPSLEALKDLMEVFIYDPSVMTEELLQTRYTNMMRNDGEHLKNFVKNLSAQYAAGRVTDHSRRLGEIKAKTLATQGVNDRMIPFDHGLKLATGIADCRLVVFNKCGHWVQWEHAEEFNRMVIDFLRS